MHSHLTNGHRGNVTCTLGILQVWSTLLPFSESGKALICHCVIGLSKERPILDHHPNAHIHEIRRISCEIHPKPYKIRCFNKNSSVWGGVQGGGYDPGSTCEIRRISLKVERPLASESVTLGDCNL